MSEAPIHPSGFPDGTEGIASVITDTRESLDSGNRVVNRDSYFGPPAWVSSTTYGALGSNFYRMSYGYDSKGRMNHSVDWTGTIRDTTYDGRDRVTQTKIGTNDTGAPNMIQDFGYEYDGNLIGNDTLTKSRQFTSASVSLDTIYTNDFRDRLTQTKTPDSVITVRTLNNLSEVTQEQTYAGSVSAANLRSQSQSLINEKRQAYQTIAFNVDPTNGTVGHSLTYNLWYNGRGSQIKSKGPNGQFQKTQYDGARRVTAQFVCYDDSELNTDYLQAFSVNAGVGFTGDTVIEETVNAYDSDGNLIQTTSYRRTPGTALLGDLGTAWAVADSRRTFTAQWFDPANRITSFVDYGTNGGATFTRPGTPPAPSSSLTILVTQYSYDTGGRQNDVHDNKNRLTSKTFDGLNRVTQTVENYVTGIPVDQSLDRERTTYVTFDMGGRVSTRVAKNPKGLFNGVEKQMTTYVYGTAANPARNDLLIAEIYPDSDDIPSPLGNGPDAVYDRVEYTYDYASRRSTIKDQRATVRTWNYDATTGRLTSEAVTTLGTGVDGAVQRKEYAYDGVSRLLTATSYSAPSGGTVVNEVKYTYDGYWNAIKREENHAGVVGGGTPSYQVAYADGGAPAKYVRPSSMTYPNGGIVYVNYQADTTGSGKLSRIDNFSSVANDPHSGTTTPYAVYNYLGAGNIMDITHPRITTLGTDGLVYRVGSDGNPGAWDVLGRVIETKWRNTANNNSLDLLDYIYDATSNRTTRQINSTIKPALGQEKDEAYTYDGLDRLTKENRGLLSGGTITDANRNFGQNWNALESLGNWRGFQVAPTGGSSYSFIQTRSHNWANEIDIDNNDNLPPGVSISNSWIAPTYDKAGNTTTSPVPGNETAGYFYTYNAWNRLVKVQNGTRAAPGTEVAEYQYDAQNYRIAKLVPNGSNWDRTDCYYNFRWQCVEERKNLNVVGKTTVATIGLAQYVWDLRYSDAPIVRFRNADGSADGSLEEKLYYCQDANFNTNTLVNESTGAVVERYIYDAYGKASLFDLNWNAQASTVYRNEILFAGYRFDPESALYNVRNRVYHPTLGRWLQRDPLSYDAGSMDLYEYCLSAPIVNTDPMGLLTPASNPCDDAYVACRAHCIGRTGKELEWCVESCEQDADHCYKEHRALGQRLPFHIGVTKLTIIIYGTGAAIQGGVLAGTIGAGAVATGGAAAGVVGAGTSGIVPTGVVAGTTTAGAAAWLNMSAQVQALQAQLTLLFYQLRLTCDETGKQVLWGQIRAIEAAIEQILNRMKNF
jgi:RHS repeat-associated protein